MEFSISRAGRRRGPVSGPPLVRALRLPDGCRVRGRGLRRPLPEGPVPDFGLYLGTSRLRRRHDGELGWPRTWIDWPDFLLPRDQDQAARRIRALHEQARAGAAVEVACGGRRRPHRHRPCLPRRSGRTEPTGRCRLDPGTPSPPGRRDPLAAPLGGPVPEPLTAGSPGLEDAPGCRPPLVRRGGLALWLQRCTAPMAGVLSHRGGALPPHRVLRALVPWARVRATDGWWRRGGGRRPRCRVPRR